MPYCPATNGHAFRLENRVYSPVNEAHREVDGSAAAGLPDIHATLMNDEIYNPWASVFHNYIELPGQRPRHFPGGVADSTLHTVNRSR
jgi:hypothetical protein